MLLVSPRPEEQGVGYTDHRVSALPLVEAVEGLGELAQLSVLSPPTFNALDHELKKAEEAGEPYGRGALRRTRPLRPEGGLRRPLP